MTNFFMNLFILLFVILFGVLLFNIGKEHKAYKFSWRNWWTGVILILLFSGLAFFAGLNYR